MLTSNHTLNDFWCYPKTLLRVISYTHHWFHPLVNTWEEFGEKFEILTCFKETREAVVRQH
ncbi:hypothetical protein H5410_064137 [Solanum commersonii]|uniref:Uncharacterized protein n=1 Tax=Solanum commersonii TaxID=4109 RepID=A0A9J5W0C1_SOLCO|nr:hypothetical protein H5410_064137 [Solanum commersonii]